MPGPSSFNRLMEVPLIGMVTCKRNCLKELGVEDFGKEQVVAYTRKGVRS